LRAYAQQHGHSVGLLDLNTDDEVFGTQRSYFDEVKRQFPRWRNWNIERNGTEMLAMHQVLYHRGRQSPAYRALVAELLNALGLPPDKMAAQLNVRAFDTIFSRLYTRVTALVSQKLAEVKPEVVGVSLFNSTWPGTLFILRLVKSLLPNVRTVVGGPGPIMGFTASHDEIERFCAAEPDLDFYVTGEGEGPFLEILENPSRAPGILGTGSAAVRLGDLPLPDYGELPTDRYLQLSIASSRGCPFECSFCAETVYWKGFRRVAADRLFEQLQTLASKHRRSGFYLCDSLSNAVIGPLAAQILERAGLSRSIAICAPTSPASIRGAPSCGRRAACGVRAWEWSRRARGFSMRWSR
jgi:hypothetical protein